MRAKDVAAAHKLLGALSQAVERESKIFAANVFSMEARVTSAFLFADVVLPVTEKIWQAMRQAALEHCAAEIAELKKRLAVLGIGTSPQDLQELRDYRNSRSSE